MAADPGAVAIADLRWPVTLALRSQSPDSGTSIAETLTEKMTVRAQILPLGAMTFLAGAQTDRPVTHRIRLRWLDWIDETYVVLRRTTRQDGTIRTEIFRIRQIGEINGRKRYTELLVEQESRT